MRDCLPTTVSALGFTAPLAACGSGTSTSTTGTTDPTDADGDRADRLEQLYERHYQGYLKPNPIKATLIGDPTGLDSL